MIFPRNFPRIFPRIFPIIFPRNFPKDFSTVSCMCMAVVWYRWHRPINALRRVKATCIKMLNYVSLFQFYICLYAFYETNYFQTATKMPLCFRRVEKPIAMVGCSP